MRILLVEDHKATADRLSVLLKKAEESLEISIAHTLADGLRMSDEIEPDITLLDLCLPDCESWRDTVAAIPKFKPPVIVVTDMEDPDIKVEAYRAGAENVFKKRTILTVASVLISAATSARMRRLVKEEHDAPIPS